MKVTYLAQPTILHVTPQELYELGIGVEGKLISVGSSYKHYIGDYYYWMIHRDTVRLCNPSDHSDWWGHIDEPWCTQNSLDMILEVQL